MEFSKKKQVNINIFNEEEEENLALNYQKKFLKAFINNNKGFGERMVDIVSLDFFDGLIKKILEYELVYFEKRKKIAKYDTLKDNIAFQEKGILKEQLTSLIDEIHTLEIEDIEEVEQNAYAFFKKKSVKNVIYKLVENWQNNQWDDMKTLLENALKAGEAKELGHNYYEEINKRLSKDFRNPIPCMDKLNEDMGGGLANGEFGVILAPPGGGKSMMLVVFAVTALLAGKKVVYYTMELDEKVIGQRFDASICDIELWNVFDFPEYIKEILEDIKIKTGGELIIREFEAGVATVNTISSHIMTLESQDNFIPDIVFVDYADLLKPTTEYKEKRHSIDNICTSLRGVAKRMQIPIWSAAQTNREGLDNEQVRVRNIGESLGIAGIADVIIGVGRPDSLKEINEAVIGILKNRNGKDGIYKPAIFDTNKVHIKIKDIDASQILVPGGKKQSSKNKQEEMEESMEEIFLFLNNSKTSEQ